MSEYFYLQIKFCCKISNFYIKLAKFYVKICKRGLIKNKRIKLAWYEMHKEIAVLQFPKGVESLIRESRVLQTNGHLYP